MYTADDFFPKYLWTKKFQRTTLKGITNLRQHDVTMHILIALDTTFKRL